MGRPHELLLLLITVTASLAWACTSPTSSGTGSEEEPSKDGSTTHSSSTDNESAACIDEVSSAGSGNHNAGQDCLSCHSTFAADKRWTVAGTLYSDKSGGSVVSGATIEITDADDKVIRLHTADNGNFYTTKAVTFPLKVRASQCPSNAEMPTSAATGSCNTSSCHDSSQRIHLP
jgi:hypothetical protein